MRRYALFRLLTRLLDLFIIGIYYGFARQRLHRSSAGGVKKAGRRSAQRYKDRERHALQRLLPLPLQRLLLTPLRLTGTERVPTLSPAGQVQQARRARLASMTMHGLATTVSARPAGYRSSVLYKS